ncbi:uncharacterized protein LOC113494086 [Trichoplusia ni]|uniref:Uncharacterized protein LOC113494086 n=1 Tax=Trichoplusia ni TaxID=7111 RepID=A0A7E5VIF3_TRINI|nr:uncharacterized protein LOC113494086 [Trichoplusia ni]
MSACVYLLVVLAACAHAVNICILDAPDVNAELQPNPLGGMNIVLERRGLSEVIAVVGRQAGAIKDVVQDGDVVIQFANDTTVRISNEEIAGERRGYLLTFTWEAPKTVKLEDCVNLGTHHWYGGPQQKRQYWPIERLVLPNYSYVTKEADNCAVAEPYWLNSEGIFYYFDKKVPLFVDQNDLEKNAACFIAQTKPPYSSKRDKNDLIYAIGIFEDVRQAHEFAVEKYLEKPTGIPDERMITYPIWSTWARYKRDVNHATVLKFADEITHHGFPNSQLEIDDLWETCYGSQIVDERRFPSMKNTVDVLRAKGYRVTMWTHPFINKGCEPWYSEAKAKGYLVSSEYGSVETSWWNDNETTTAVIDFTKPDARQWYLDRMHALKNSSGVDSFKFDGGESSWAPQIPVLRGDIRDQPGVISADYVRTVAQFGPLVEVRVGYRTQDLPVFIRMIDKDTYWTYENGLPTLITTLLQMNMNGYSLVLPDMIGGNGYNEPPTKELFIRWLQANTFMPSMQFSYVPWEFDNETVEISKKYVQLHAQYAPEIIKACQRAVADGSPVNPPVWWIAPNDTEAHDIADQYLLGENILVAPVIERGARSRDVYLPHGSWLAQGDRARPLPGGDWVRNYPAPLDTLPYFVKNTMVGLKALVVTALITGAFSAAEVVGPSIRGDDVTLTLEPVLTGGFNVILIEENERSTLGQIGRTLEGPYTVEEIEGGVFVQIGNVNLTLKTVYDASAKARGIKFDWQASAAHRLEDCIDFGSKHWYAGPMQVDQLYPIENATQVYKASYIQEIDNAAIIERYWLNSAGEYIFVHDKVPLFFDYKNIMSNHICFGAQIAGPYSSQRPRTILTYDMWFLENVKEAHKHAVANYLGKPSGTPDFRMVQHPVWSTWAQYSREINDTKLLDFAQQIRDHGFEDSQLEIDDQWELCYGSLTVDEAKFPDFKKTIQDIRALGYRVTIWAHPFINNNCEPWYSEALRNNYFVVDETGNPNTSWWNNNGSIPGYIDFTNPEAAEWYYQRMKAVLDTYDIDSVKFDAGAAPEIAVQRGDIELQPHHLVQAYAKLCARFGGMVEFRAGFRTQDLPIYVRMCDRDSIWGLNNGLATTITTTFQMNLNGYPFVLPDMIGGNGFNLEHEQADLPTKELFIRWVQANTFLPVMQYSYAPWNFDNETVQISKKYTELHAQYAELIFSAMEAAVSDGTPVNTPLWWSDPNDQEALLIWDEYLLAETILVAPVLTEGATSRDIYLPAGTWYEEGDRARAVEGPIWIKNHPAPLDVLPYFVRDKQNVPDAGTTLYTSAALVLLGLVANIVHLI